MVTAASATAAPSAAPTPDASNAEMPTAGTSGVQKADSITETDNAPTASVTQLTPRRINLPHRSSWKKF